MKPSAPIPDCFSPAERVAAESISTAMARLAPNDRDRVGAILGSFDAEQSVRHLDAIAADPYLPIQAKRELARPLLHDAQAERARLGVGIKHHEQAKALCQRHIDAMRELEDWSQKPPKLAIERNDCSRLHKLKEAAQRGDLIDGSSKGGEMIAQKDTALNKASHTFVVKHDWARAFEHAADWKSGEFKLPYDLCCFEFRLDGRTIILWAMNTSTIPDIDRDMSVTAFVECGECWYSPPETPVDDFERYLWDQVRAICISLDADIAVTTVERASISLNEKRQKAGKQPLSDFHVVDLARRHRIANPAAGAGEGTRKRLHFRRGHWRHYETSKTWVKWCLVGNPDLGFISKQYTL